MAIDVTVLGASGTTVTIPFTSAANAAAAQAALFSITHQVSGGSLEQVNYTGGSTLPGIASPATVGGALALGAATLPAFSIGGQYVSAVLGGGSAQTLLVGFGANDATVVSGAGGSTVSGSPAVTGAGGAEIGNLGTNTQVFLGGSSLQSFSELGVPGISPSATVWVTTSEKGTTNFDDSAGSTTIKLDALVSSTNVSHVFGQTLIISSEGTGTTTVDISTPSSTVAGTVYDGDVLSFRGTSTVATTVNAAGMGTDTAHPSLWALLKSGNAYINGNGSDVILFPTGGTSVSATLFGGTGSDIDIGGGGLIQAGSGGNSVLYGSTLANSTTLIGGGSNDILVSQSTGTELTAGPGAEFLFGLSAGTTFNGDPVAQPAGIQTLMDGTTGGDTFVTGFAAAGTVTGAGAGGTNIFAVSDSNGGNLYKEGVVNTGTGVDANSATINGFSSGLDSISLSDPAGGSYTTVTGSTPTSSEVAVAGSGANTIVTFGDGTTWTIMNATVTGANFH